MPEIPAQVTTAAVDTNTADGFAPIGNTAGAHGAGITLSLQRIATSASQVLAAFVASAPPRRCDLTRGIPDQPDQGSGCRRTTANYGLAQVFWWLMTQATIKGFTPEPCAPMGDTW